MSNIYVIGDLVIDHTVFVKEPSGYPRGNEGESIYEVVSRIDTAGGAATCARILAIINKGETILWGMTGESNWGSFRSILANCHVLDSARCSIEFRGVHDETQAQMNTITRLILVRGNPPDFDRHTIAARFDDYGHVHVSDDKRESLLHYLERARAKLMKIDAIIINDIDMNCLTPDIIQKIATFANAVDPPIPLFIDPKRGRGKYVDIEGTAILPNLAEWCYLVGENDESAAGVWRRGLDQPEMLEKMAQLSFKHLGNFRYHIITCGESGAVIIAPHPDKSDCYAVYRVQPHKTQRPNPPTQLGCGDIMTAVFAMEYANSSPRDTKAALKAFGKANAVVACYRDMPWQRMPLPDMIQKAQRWPVKPKLLAEPSKGMLFLPKESAVWMLKRETACPNLYTWDKTFSERIESILKDVQEEWKGQLRSVIIGAPSGSGKTTIIKAIKEISKQSGIKVEDFPDPKKVNWNDLNTYFDELSESAAKGRLLVIADEALKGETAKRLKKYGVVMLNAAHTRNIRFVFLDALFEPGEEASEFTSRCAPYYLSGLNERPKDIPLIVAGVVFDRDKARSFNSLRVEGEFLLAITNATLSKPNPRVLCQWVDQAYDKAYGEWDKKDQQLNFKLTHLPKAVPVNRHVENIGLGSYEFHRGR